MLVAQREACAACIAGQRHQGWVEAGEIYDDGGFSGGNMERPAMQRLPDLDAAVVDCVQGAGATASDRIANGRAHDLQAALRSLVERIDVHDDRADIVVNARSLCPGKSLGYFGVKQFRDIHIER